MGVSSLTSHFAISVQEVTDSCFGFRYFELLLPQKSSLTVEPWPKRPFSPRAYKRLLPLARQQPLLSRFLLPDCARTSFKAQINNHGNAHLIVTTHWCPVGNLLGVASPALRSQKAPEGIATSSPLPFYLPTTYQLNNYKLFNKHTCAVR